MVSRSPVALGDFSNKWSCLARGNEVRYQQRLGSVALVEQLLPTAVVRHVACEPRLTSPSSAANPRELTTRLGSGKLPQASRVTSATYPIQDATQYPVKQDPVHSLTPAEPESLAAQELTHTMAGGSSHRSAFKRLLKELEKWRAEAEEETGVERLGPPDDEDLLTWEAVINGRGIGSGYDGS